MKVRWMLLPVLAAGCGFAAFFLRVVENRTGFEYPTGLAVPGNGAWTALLILFAAVCVVTFVLTRSVPDSPAPAFPFSTEHRALLALPVAGALLLALAGGAELLDGLRYAPEAESGVTGSLYSSTEAAVRGVLTLLFAGSVFLSAAACRRREWRERQRRRTLFRGEILLIPPVVLIVRLLMAYRRDSVDPVLQRCLPEMAALVALSMGYFLLSSFAFQEGNLRRFTRWVIPVQVLCLAAAADTRNGAADPLTFLGAAAALLGFLFLAMQAKVPAAPPPSPKD